MGALVYSMLTSADGYVRDARGGFDWAEPDEEVHAFINETMRAQGTYLMGRRMYEAMTFWETSNDVPGMGLVHYEFGSIWRAAQKVVYSTTLAAPVTARTRVERAFDADAVRALKASSSLDISIAGPTLAWQAIAAGLVDEFGIFACPAAVGGGLPFFPPGLRVDLTLVERRDFASGIVYSRYVPRGATTLVPS